MKQSQLFTKLNKEAPHDADSVNARLLIQAGFIDQVSAGVFAYLPLGLRVLRKIQNIVREEMNALGAQEIYMPALVPRELWDVTERWDKIDVNFRVEGHGGKMYALGSTHEEVVTGIVKKFVQSYKDLPLSVYQIQDKYRNEARAKSGLLRGREFSMKDLYSFHLNEEDFWVFYEKSKQAYLNVFTRCGLDAKIVEASGGVFSKYSHEFQVYTQAGEDHVYEDKEGRLVNRELIEEKDWNSDAYTVHKSIEVGNIFPLKTRFTDAFDVKVQDADGARQDVFMGCYGIGPSRVMGSIIEVHHDERGMIWPASVAPFAVHLLSLQAKDDAANEAIETAASDLYEQLMARGVEVLWDDRGDVRAGEKFAEADLVGIPLRLLVSEKTLAEQSVEWKRRHESESRFVALETVLEEIIQEINP